MASTIPASSASVAGRMVRAAGGAAPRMRHGLAAMASSATAVAMIVRQQGIGVRLAGGPVARPACQARTIGGVMSSSTRCRRWGANGRQQLRYSAGCGA